VSELSGRTVVVTRPADQSAALVTALHARGARAIVAPAIEVVASRSAALTRALRDLEAGGFAWIVLTSRATVEVLESRLASARALGETRVAAIGEGTADAFRRWARRRPDLVPPTFTTQSLVRSFPRGTGRVLCARADIAPPGLEDGLAAKGWSPTRVDAYRTRMARSLPEEAREALAAGDVDAVTFTSASTVRGFVGAIATVRGTPRVVCIGPVTAKEARAHGLTVHAVARPHTIDGLVEAVHRALRRRATAPKRRDGGAEADVAGTLAR
jgi:uroporphyrinogen-III synthase